MYSLFRPGRIEKRAVYRNIQEMDVIVGCGIVEELEFPDTGMKTKYGENSLLKANKELTIGNVV